MVKEVMLFGNGGCPCFIGFDWGVLTSGGYTKKALKKGGFYSWGKGALRFIHATWLGNTMLRLMPV